MSLLIGSFMGRKRYGGDGKNRPLVAIILAVIFAFLLWLLYEKTYDFSSASAPARSDRRFAAIPLSPLQQVHLVPPYRITKNFIPCAVRLRTRTSIVVRVPEMLVLPSS
jgi:hypothetical protein